MADQHTLARGDRSVLACRVTCILLIALVLTSVAGLATGAAGTSLWRALTDIAKGLELPLRDHVVLFDIRAPPGDHGVPGRCRPRGVWRPVAGVV